METVKLGAEHSVIGCILHGQNDSQIFADMSEQDFISDDCRELFVILRDYWMQYKTADIACVPKEYRELALQCYEFLPSASSWRMYIAAAKEDSAKDKSQKLLFNLATGNFSLEEIQDGVGELAKITQGNEKVRRMDMMAALETFWKDQGSKPSYIKTGYPSLDKITFFQGGDYVVVGARPSTGKTALGLTLAKELAKQGLKTGFYSYETTIEKMIGRTIAAHCDLNMYDIKRRSIEQEKAEHLGEDLSWYPMEFIESAGKSIEWIKADVIRNNIKAVIIDYIGLVPSQGQSRFEKVTNTSMAIRDLCQSTGCIVFALAQISRQGRDAPTMEDLKESGQIEQDADAVLLLHNTTELAERGTISQINLIVAKNKEGEVGCINMVFDGAKQRFWEESNREY